MQIVFHRRFRKQLQKLSSKDQKLVKQRLHMFAQEPYAVKLQNHPLQGKYREYRSISIKPDLRALYKQIDKNTSEFILLGSHSQLYR